MKRSVGGFCESTYQELCERDGDSALSTARDAGIS